MQLPFHTLDVFTDRTFGGNPLGVFPDATHLPTDLMQRIAMEMHLSETVFLGPPETTDGSARVRIFTPGREVPFAGHPTVGSAIFLAARGEGIDESDGGSRCGEAQGEQALTEAETADCVTFILEENVGPVPVVVRLENGTPVFAQFTTAVLPEHRPSPHTRDALASMVGLDAADVCPHGMPVEMVSCGLEYHIIPVRTLDAIRRAVLDMALWRQMVADGWAHHVYLFCPESEGEGVDARVRMFAPGSGVPEDPATGSAAAALGGYLSKIDGRPAASLSWTIEQGIEMGRPSIIHVEADRAEGDTTAVRVGGSAVLVSRGMMTIQE